jgi:hypothetical protein
LVISMAVVVVAYACGRVVRSSLLRKIKKSIATGLAMLNKLPCIMVNVL